MKESEIGRKHDVEDIVRQDTRTHESQSLVDGGLVQIHQEYLLLAHLGSHLSNTSSHLTSTENSNRIDLSLTYELR